MEPLGILAYRVAAGGDHQPQHVGKDASCLSSSDERLRVSEGSSSSTGGLVIESRPAPGHRGPVNSHSCDAMETKA